MRTLLAIAILTLVSFSASAQETRSEQPVMLISGAPSANEVTVHPNPGKNYFNIKLELEEKQEVRMDLYDLLGNHRAEVLPEQPMGKGKYSVGLYTTGYKEGIYYLLVRYNNQQVKVKRVVITK